MVAEDENDAMGENGGQEDLYLDYHQGNDMPLHEKMEFEKWVRQVIYGKRVQDLPMQRVKSRIMYGVSRCFLHSFVMIIIGVQAGYRYSFKSYFRVANTGFALTTLIYLKSSLLVAIALLGLFAWFTRSLLRIPVLKGYVVLRVLEYIVEWWLMIALFMDYGSAPFQKQPGGMTGVIAIFYACLALCLFSIVYVPLHLLNLRRAWVQYRVRAFRRYKQSLEEHSTNKSRAAALDSQVFERVPSARESENGLSQNYVEIDFSTPVTAEDPQPFPTPMEATTEEYNRHETNYAEYEGSQEYDKLISTATPANVQLDLFASISHNEFMLRWESMPISGTFERAIKRIPTREELTSFLQPKGFPIIHSDQTEYEGAVYERSYAFAQLHGSVFLVEFLFAVDELRLYATFKCQDEANIPHFVSALQLQHLLY